MNQWNGPWGCLNLGRFPFEGDDPSHQAWSGADRILADDFMKLLPDLPGEGASVLILNDAFGALACLACSQGLRVQSMGDSWIARHSCVENLIHNNLDPTLVHQYRFQDAPVQWLGPVDPAVVLMRLPANRDMLAWELELLKKHCKPGTPILIGALMKDLPPAVPALVRQILGSGDPSLAAYKARVIRAEVPPRSSKVGQAGESGSTATTGKTGESGAWPKLLDMPGYPGITLVNYPGVFSRDGVDPAGLFLLDRIFAKACLDKPAGSDPDSQEQPVVVDLGCGNGMLGLALSQRYRDYRYVFTDESWMAIEGVREGWERLWKDGSHCGAEFVWTHSLGGMARGRADWIICNPPFHFQGAQTLSPAFHMFAQSAQVLKPGGSLLVVANRHLGHHQNLKRWFGRVDVIGDNGKFLVIQARNPME